jgi:TRAP-type C4-dicarboxylate transport system substrate-binding protein
MRFSAGVLLVALFAGTAAADPVTLRFASLVPEGTAWSRELRAFAREVETLSNGKLRVKWYFGGIAGDESVVPERINKGQLDGEAVGVSCADLAPSLRVLRVVGLFRQRGEAHWVIGKLRQRVEEEIQKRGLRLMAVTWFGSDIAMTREPVRSLADLRRQKLWIWNLDKVWLTELKMLGLQIVPLPVEEAARAYEEGRVDGFLALPTASLAFQWSTRARWYSNLTLASMAACTVVSSRSFDALPIESQQALRAAATKTNARFEDVSGTQEDALVGGLFEKQGLKLAPASMAFRAELLDAARAARETLPDSVVPHALITEVQGWLSDFRAEHP